MVVEMIGLIVAVTVTGLIALGVNYDTARAWRRNGRSFGFESDNRRHRE